MGRGRSDWTLLHKDSGYGMNGFQIPCPCNEYKHKMFHLHDHENGEIQINNYYK